MQIYIARDGAEIGEYPREKVAELARAGQLLPNDYYWHEGMVDWLFLSDLLGPDGWKPLPPTPFYQHRFAIPAAICAAFLIAGLIGIFLINSGKPEGVTKVASLRPASPVTPSQQSDAEVRDKAAADLDQKIERLPGSATPPWNTSFYDITINMQKSLAHHTPWTAIVRGSENIVDPTTEQTTKRTQFTLITDYHEGAWTFRHYRATATDLTNSAITEIEDDENAPTPPSIVGMLGLKRE